MAGSPDRLSHMSAPCKPVQIISLPLIIYPHLLVKPQKKEQYRKNVQVVVQAMEENDILEKRIQRLENLDEYYKRGERAKRAHRLITKGAAIEHILPESKEIEDADFYQLMEKMLRTAEAQKTWKAYQERHPRPPEGGDS